MAEHDPWAELFARAEGKEPNESQPPKRQRLDDPFELYLQNRLKVTNEWPNFLKLTRSLMPLCRGWRGDPDSCCQGCGYTAFVHIVKLDKAKDTKWQHLLFCFLRNVRCFCRYKVAGEKVEQGKTIKKQHKELAKIIPSLPENTGLHEKWNILHDLIEKRIYSGLSELQFVQMIMACDAVYYQLYYLQITKHPSLKGGDLLFIPHPVQYFATGPTGYMKEVISDDIPDELVDELSQRYGLKLEPVAEHPLSAIHNYRYQETVWLFVKHNLAVKLHGEAIDQAKNVTKDHETPAPKLLMDWRDSCRDFLCHLYAYATIPQSSVQQIQDLLSDIQVKEIVEFGAGTGYMAQLFQERGIRVEAFDICPPATMEENEYHGSTPTFVPVGKGSAKSLNKLQNLKSKALLLCYPPPNSPMAHDTLRNFTARGGKVLIHIGEFKGLTGSAEFEHMLVAYFECIVRIPCLTWGTDASEVTLWRKNELKRAPSLLLPCSQCKTMESTRRCRFIRYLCYCSKECFYRHRQSFREHLKFSITAEDEGIFDFDDTTQFSCI